MAALRAEEQRARHLIAFPADAPTADEENSLPLLNAETRLIGGPMVRELLQVTNLRLQDFYQELHWRERATKAEELPTAHAGFAHTADDESDDPLDILLNFHDALMALEGAMRHEVG
jgi:hypothetical protein